MMSDTTVSEIDQAIAAALAGEGGTRDLGPLLRRYWARESAEMFARSLPGHEIALRLAGTMDDIVNGLMKGLGLSRVAVVATGGYGRGRLAPHSDIDMLFLLPPRFDEEALMPFFYALWDAGLPLSHTVHTPASAIKSARQDLVTCTAFLDARFLCGSRAVFDKFLGLYDDLRSRTLARFVEAKMKERDDRHDQNDLSRYVIEPDVKEGKGGLRDLDTLHWLDRYVMGVGSDPALPIESPGLFTAREKRRLRLIAEFLWSVRVHLHRHVGRADETLHFSVQPTLAQQLGYRASGSSTATERFLRHYFLTAREVGRLTGAACAVLERRALKRARTKGGGIRSDRALSGMLPEGIALRHDRVAFADEAAEAAGPAEVLSLFKAAADTGLPLHPTAFKLVARCARTMTYERFIEPTLTARFMSILTDSRELAPVLRMMAETGFLGRVLPAFGGVEGKVEYGLYRRFTLDEHILRSIGVLDDICLDRGRDLGVDPATQSFARDNRLPVCLALLLQEIAQVVSDPTPERVGFRIKRRIGELTGSSDIGALVAFAVNHQNLLLRTAMRRDVTEPRILSLLAETIASTERLSMLSVVTVCRQRVAGIGSWDEHSRRTEQLLEKLIAIRIDGGEEAAQAFLDTRTSRFQTRVDALLSPDERRRFAEFLGSAGPTFWQFADVATAADLAALATATEEAGERGRALVQAGADSSLQILVYTEDRSTLFAECAGVVAEIGGTVISAQGFALPRRANGRVPAVVMLKANRASSPPEPFRLTGEEKERLSDRFDKVAKGNGSKPRVPPPPINDLRTVFDVAPEVRVDTEESEHSLIVEVEARDRPGLLYLLASSLAEIGVDIDLALVATYGHRAVDTFYVRDTPGYKITEPRRIEAVRRQLMRVVFDD